MQMMTSAIYGNQVTPAALCDDKGNAVVVQHAATPWWLEHLLRPVNIMSSMTAHWHYMLARCILRYEDGLRKQVQLISKLRCPAFFVHETLFRTLMWQVCTSMGCSAGFATAPLSGKAMKACAVPHTLSLAWRLGRAILAAHHAKADPVAAVAAEGHGAVLFSGMCHFLFVIKATTYP